MLKTQVLVPIKLIEPSPTMLARAQAAVLETSNQLKITEEQIQPDLLYFESILVTAGFNDNDDVFLNSELKSAISSPVLKPINWQHNEKDIVGVIYSVEPRNFDGKSIADVDGFANPFELAVQGAVWHLLPHLQSKAESIKERISKGDLYVSMECWFDSYDYAFADESNKLIEVLPRDKNEFMEGLLKANGGAGKLDKYRVGRALRNIVFAGMGLVDHPANKRSVILSLVDGYRNKTTNTFAKDKEIKNKEKLVMAEPMVPLAAQASTAETVNIVKQVLNEAKKDEDLSSARKEIARLEAELKVVNDRVVQLTSQLGSMSREVDGAVATIVTPEEIARIDKSEDKFAAKLAFLKESRQKASAAPSDEVKTLREENRKLKANMRETEILTLFKDLDVFTQEELAQSVSYAQSLDDSQYVAWLNERKLLAKKIKDLREKANLVPQDGPEKLGEDGSELKRMGKGPKQVPLKTLSSAAIEELFTEVEEPNLGDASADASDKENPMQTMVASLLSGRKSKNQK